MPSRLALGLAAALLLAACATASPRFPQDVATAFARDDMRRMETEHLLVYYPAQHAEAARSIAARLEQCAGKLRAKAVTRRARDRFTVFLTSAEFNNAYVQPVVLGNPMQMVLPLHTTLESFDLFDIGTNAAGDISCHEAVHYVTFEQIEGFWRGLNVFFGGLLSPQSFVDSWFHEGMSTWYEARLGKPVGRPLSPYWRGAFAAGAASEEGLDPGFLNPEQRLQDPYGPQYLTGLAFVDYLARRFGEEKLWQLVDKQGRSVFSPLGVTLRFKSVYGQSIGSLFDDFEKELKATEAKRVRPPAQRVLAGDVGYVARLATARDGTLATLSAGRDEPARLTLRERDGRIRASRRMTHVLPFRPFIVSNPIAVSGLTFSPDGRWLYLLLADLDSDTSFTARLLQFDARTADLQRVWDELPGVGGCVTADGQGYVYVEYDGDRAALNRFDLAAGTRSRLADFPRGTTVTAPACAPEGGRVAFAQRGERGFDLYLREEDGSVARLTEDGRYNTGPRWLDAGHLVFVRELGGRAQAHVLDVATRGLWPTTDAPFGVFDPVPFGEREVAFLNREGWGFTLDVAPRLPAPAQPTLAAAPPVPEDLGPGLLAGAGRATEPVPPSAVPTAVEPVPPLAVKSDEPYHWYDHLFVPELHAPFIGLYPTADTSTADPDDFDWRLLLSLSLQGSDRLGQHLWAINLAYDTDDKLPSATVQYGNYQLAPWFIDLTGALVNVGPAYDRYAELGVSRTFWTTPVRMQFLGIDHHDVDYDLDTDTSTLLGRYRFIGPGLMAAYGAAESTPYGGLRRGLALYAGGNYFPKYLGSDYDLGDVSGSLDLWVPLPISRRHSLSVGGRGRALLSTTDQQLLEIGGIARGSILRDYGYAARPQQQRAADLRLLGAPQLLFGEYLRGYPDFTTRGSAYAAASASYRYPFIIDYGWASLLYVLPAFFLRQVDLEAWGEMAWIWPGTLTRRSAGGALHLRMTLGNLPMTLFVEVAERFDADTASNPYGYVGLAFE